jgi:CheY-like chemotaxis protein
MPGHDSATRLCGPLKCCETRCSGLSRYGTVAAFSVRMDCALEMDFEMQRSRILVVADEPSLLAALDSVLAEDGHEVTGTCYASDALALAREMLPDLILSGLALPGLSGRELMQVLRQHPSTADIPVVFFTSARASDAPPGSSDDGLPAPIPRAELPERVRRGIALGVPAGQF